jgi:hypothetical protein
MNPMDANTESVLSIKGLCFTDVSRVRRRPQTFALTRQPMAANFALIVTPPEPAL